MALIPYAASNEIIETPKCAEISEILVDSGLETSRSNYRLFFINGFDERIIFVDFTESACVN